MGFPHDSQLRGSGVSVRRDVGGLAGASISTFGARRARVSLLVHDACVHA